MRVAVGSLNPVKLNAVRSAFSAAFPHQQELLVEGFTVPSGVSDQPWGEQETRDGALRRAGGCRDAFIAAHGVSPDFAVGLEGGVASEPLAGSHPDVADLPAEAVHCFAWMAIVRPSSQSPTWGLARTATFALPPPVVRLMRGTAEQQPMELGHADDAVFADVNSKQKGGTVGKVTRGTIDRTAYYVHALHLALAPFMHDDSGVYADGEGRF